MKVALIGAHGKVGRLLVPILVSHGATVGGIVRTHAQLPLVTEVGGQGMLLDVEHSSTRELAQALGGYDALVWCAGAGGGDRERTYAVDRDAAIRSMDAALEASVARYVMVSWIKSGPDHGVDEASTFFPYADAKAAADSYLRGTDLAWTILGPARLTDAEPRGAVTLLDDDAPVPDGATVPRQDLAMVAAEAVRQPHSAHRFVRFVTGDTPILELFSD